MLDNSELKDFQKKDNNMTKEWNNMSKQMLKDCFLSLK